MLFENPGLLTPSTAASDSIDNVVVRSGTTITVSAGSDNKSNGSLEVEGTLDLTTTTGHTFTTITGGGDIRLGADNFPTGDASDFTTAGLGEGRVIFEGTSTINFAGATGTTFYNFEVDMSGQTFVLLNDLTVNGDLTVTAGTFQINDATAAVQRTVTVEQNVTVLAAGAITVGTLSLIHI